MSLPRFPPAGKEGPEGPLQTATKSMVVGARGFEPPTSWSRTTPGGESPKASEDPSPSPGKKKPDDETR